MADKANDPESAEGLRGLVSDRSGVAIGLAIENTLLKGEFPHVTPEDLKGVSYDDLESLPEKAKSLNDQREDTAQATLKQMFADRGVEDVDAAVKEFLDGGGKPAPVVDAAALDRVRQVGGAGGSATQVRNVDHLANDGQGMMLDYFKNGDPMKKS